MCGICGYISKTEYDEQVLRDMTDVMLHRGPDDGGVYQTNTREGKYVGLGHRRLSILDLSMAGHQPMHSGDGRYSIVYNGEIYNFKTLRDDLRAKGYQFKSDCDTEVLLYLYAYYGVECLEKINGMFAIAIWDRECETLLLARDRCGKKPIYYYLDSSKQDFVFGSELKNIMAYPGFRKEVRSELISSFLCNKSIASPDTIFKNTYKLEPGQYMLVETKNDTIGIEKHLYWDVCQIYERESHNKDTDFDKAKTELRERLTEAVATRMVADVPVGCFLSGGIDSTLTTAIARQVSEGPIQTFSIGFEDEERNEAPYAKEVADFLGTNHTEHYIKEKDLIDSLHNLVDYYDEPFSDASMIPTKLVCQLARRDVTVALSGDGGDEFFCGYEMYDWIRQIQRLDGIGGLLHGIINNPLFEGIGLSGFIDEKLMPDKVASIVNNRKPYERLECFIDMRERYTRRLVLGESLSAKYSDYEKKIFDSLKRNGDANNWQIGRMLLDMRYYMPDEVLVKTDRASMAHSLEVRCPLLDRDVVEYSFRIPHEFKYHNGEKKYILKSILYDMVPREMLDRPKKGFGVPMKKWMRGTLRDELMRYADPVRLEKQGIFDSKQVGLFIDNYQNKGQQVYDYVLFSFMLFQMWYERWVE